MHRSVHTNLILCTLFFSSLNQAHETLDKHINHCNQGYAKNCATAATAYRLLGKPATALDFERKAKEIEFEKLAIECIHDSTSDDTIQSCLECARIHTQNGDLEAIQFARTRACRKADIAWKYSIWNTKPIPIIQFILIELNDSKTAWDLFIKYLDIVKNNYSSSLTHLEILQDLSKEIQKSQLPQEYIDKVQKNITQIEDKIKAKTIK